MKTRLLLISFALTLSACSSAPQLSADQRIAEWVYDTPGVTKDVAYGRAMSWVAKSFRDSKNVLEVQDKATGKIIGKGNYPCSVLTSAMDPNKAIVRFTLDITVKDAKSRIRFEDLDMMSTNPQAAFVNNVNSAEDVQKVKNECLAQFATTFKAALAGSGASDNF